MVKLISDFGELKPGSNGGLLSQGAFGLRGIGVDLFVKIDEFGMSPAESIQVGSQSPVIEFCGGVLNEGVGRGIGGEKVDKPVRKGLYGSIGVVGGGINVENGGSAGSNIPVAKGSHTIVVKLLDPLGRASLAMRESYFEGWVVSVVLDVSVRRGGEGFFVLEDLRLEGIQSVVECFDRCDVLFFSLFDCGNERTDDVDEKDGIVVMEVPFNDGSGRPRGEWRRLVVGVIEHTRRADGRIGSWSWFHFECDSG